ncbi:MAG: DNA repair protein RadA, partial [Actinomycetaceae bacterium]|nr:DNA repair protein RadA [Actinomycetaceae bacterium]
MAKNSPRFVCNECGWATVKWVGRCGGCGSWASLEEEKAAPASAPAALAPSSPAQPITDVPATAAERQATCVDEFDRVLGGGLVPGAVILLAGEPGVGKSTLVLDVAGRAARRAQETGENPVLYVTGEESASQVRLRAERIGAMDSHLHLASESDVATIIGHAHQMMPSLLIVDSVQTIASTEVDGSAGGVSQVKAVSSALVSVAKSLNIPTVLVGHVNKEGTLAGPRVLEHLVDVVLYFEGERHSPLRMVRSVKNRYGATDEVGCFEMSDSGIKGLPDPSGLFLSARNSTVAGTCVTVTMEGLRPIPVEVQALTAPACSRPARTVSGID